MTNESPLAHPLSSSETAVNPLSDLIRFSDLRIGLPMWFMKAWQGNLLLPGTPAPEALLQYSQVFNAIEGNTTLYGLPTVQRAQTWKQMAGNNFLFSFKLPRSISQAPDMAAALHKASEFHQFMEVMGDSLGLLMLQLPGSFVPQRLPELAAVLQELKQLTSVAVAVEVRNAGFFDKSDNESGLLRLLADFDSDRVVFDSRGLFADTSQDPLVLEGQQKKPRFPVHPVATGHNPVVRFIGHSDWKMNLRYLAQWSGKLREWINEGKQPWFFIHTAANTDAPQFARWVTAQLGLEMPVWPGENPGNYSVSAEEAAVINDLFS